MESQQITTEWARQLCFDAFGVKDLDHIIFVDDGNTCWRIANKINPYVINTEIKVIELNAWYDFVNREYSHFGYDPTTKTLAIWETVTKREAHQ